MTALRLLSAKDAGAVADLFARAADYVLLETGVPPSETTVDDFLNSAPPGVDPATSVRLGAMAADGRLAGVAEMAFGYPEAPDSYIGLLLLDPLARGQGLGRAIVARLEGIARDRGARRMLIAVLAANPRGLDFWQKQGFQPDRVFPDVTYGARVHQVQRMVRDLD